MRNHNSQRVRKSCTPASVPIASPPSGNPRRLVASGAVESPFQSNLVNAHMVLSSSSPFKFSDPIDALKGRYSLVNGEFAGDLMNITPRPVLARLNRTHYRMLCLVKVPGRVSSW